MFYVFCTHWKSFRSDNEQNNIFVYEGKGVENLCILKTLVSTLKRENKKFLTVLILIQLFKSGHIF